MNIAEARRLRTTTNALAATVGTDWLIPRFGFAEDAEASAIPRKLRGFSDHDLAWFEFLSVPNIALICARLKTTPSVLMLARTYEAARRKAFPNTGAALPHVCAGIAANAAPPKALAATFSHRARNDATRDARADQASGPGVSHSEIGPPAACRADDVQRSSAKRSSSAEIARGGVR